MKSSSGFKILKKMLVINDLQLIISKSMEMQLKTNGKTIDFDGTIKKAIF